jgi:hypothetical protein
MGQEHSIPKIMCVRVPDFLVSDTYTVKRTSGKMEPGWRIASDEQCLHAGIIEPTASKQCIKNNGKWRIYMNNSQSDPNLHLCGWRYLDTTEPTRLSVHPELIGVWRSEAMEALEVLEVERAALHGLPVIPNEATG